MARAAAVLNVIYPLVPEEIREFCADKRSRADRRGRLSRIYRAGDHVELRRGDIQTRVLGKEALPQAGEYTQDVLLEGLAKFLQAGPPERPRRRQRGGKSRAACIAHKQTAAAALGPLPPRPPTFCTGCPERPVFAALKLTQGETGTDTYQHRYRLPFVRDVRAVQHGQFRPRLRHVAGQRRGGAPNMEKRPIAIMGDGGFWHNGLITGVASNLFNKGDGVLIMLQNGYTSATGQQYIPSS